MFKFFKHRDKNAAAERRLAIQRGMKRRRDSDLLDELALRANIADKLKNYKAEEDTTISNFTLAEDEVERNLVKKSARAASQDVWGQANPSEAGRWKKENRKRK